MNKTGELLYKGRMKKNITQGQLSEYLGLTYNRYNRIESGRAMLPLDLLDLACSILDLDRQTVINAIYQDQRAKAKNDVTQSGHS